MPEVISIFDIYDYEAQTARGAASLREGKIVVLPTETVYGAAGLLSDAKAHARLRQLRASTEPKPFTVHLASARDASKYIAEPTELGQRSVAPRSLLK